MAQEASSQDRAIQVTGPQCFMVLEGSPSLGSLSNLTTWTEHLSDSRVQRESIVFQSSIVIHVGWMSGLGNSCHSYLRQIHMKRQKIQAWNCKEVEQKSGGLFFVYFCWKMIAGKWVSQGLFFKVFSWSVTHSVSPSPAFQLASRRPETCESLTSGIPASACPGTLHPPVSLVTSWSTSPKVNLGVKHLGTFQLLHLLSTGNQSYQWIIISFVSSDFFFLAGTNVWQCFALLDKDETMEVFVGDVTSYVLHNLQPGTTYDLKVYAQYDAGPSAALVGQGTTCM